ncbi:DUF6278 family protein [Pseudarthrobacter raffinosi]|uniref:DUF6278 family protein n=1 Tax=Pseudarthrobacter raffinosi TaxID=2953651 RepID=UPI00208EC7B0|nr:DUF6278 family protein [Pseudarthrobacter sp. MDT3-28]MCO4236336.1 DUF6278 family protein [Pseudarthrobacter sp. MDT3-28]
MSGQPADFSRHGPGAGTARDYAIFFTRELAGGVVAVEKQLDAHLGQCSSLRQWAAARGATLADAAQGIEVLGGLLTGPERIELAPWRLKVEAGLFIGTVLVRNSPRCGGSCCPTATPSSTLRKTKTWTSSPSPAPAWKSGPRT